jgi:hypothetical protein
LLAGTVPAASGEVAEAETAADLLASVLARRSAEAGRAKRDEKMPRPR